MIFTMKGFVMDEYYVVYQGLLNVSAGAMQNGYIKLAMPGLNDLEVTRGVILRPPVTLEFESAWYADMAQGKGGKNNVIFAILLHERDESGKITGYRYIGHMGLHDITWPVGLATSGSIIVDKTCFGKGYGTEAKLLLLRHAFFHLGLRKVCSAVKVFNSNSWGHLLACGYRQVGRRREQHFSDGKFVDDVLLEVFRNDWEPIWEKYVATKQLPRLTDEQRALLQKETQSV